MYELSECVSPKSKFALSPLLYIFPIDSVVETYIMKVHRYELCVRDRMYTLSVYISQFYLGR